MGDKDEDFLSASRQAGRQKAKVEARRKVLWISTVQMIIFNFFARSAN